MAGLAINGKLWDIESGEPLIGANIFIEELKTGTVTDINELQSGFSSG